VAILGNGCALFEPRASEHPEDGDPDLDWLPPISPSAVLDNLHGAVEALEANRYPELLADEGWSRAFQFVPDPAAAGAAWGRLEEQSAWQRLCDHYQALQVQPLLQLMRTDSLVAGDSASCTADYVIHFPAGAGTAASSYSGRLHMAFSRREDTGDWAIHRWEDTGSDSLPSWTQLKQAFLWP
jgi:hypothetical protein